MYMNFQYFVHDRVFFWPLNKFTKWLYMEYIQDKKQLLMTYVTVTIQNFL
jgi:hypothetical protein